MQALLGHTLLQDRLLNAKTLCLKAAQSAARARKKTDIFVSVPSRSDGGFFVAKPQPTLLGRLAAWSDKVGVLEHTFQEKTARLGSEDMATKKAQLALAHAKQALLAGSLLLWTANRASDLRRLVVLGHCLPARTSTAVSSWSGGAYVCRQGP